MGRTETIRWYSECVRLAPEMTDDPNFPALMDLAKRCMMSDGPSHELKTWPTPFQAVWDGHKMHELRKNDRPGGFTLNDLLILREFHEHPGTYTGRTIFAVPTYITPGGSFGLPQDMVVMSIRVIGKHMNWTP